MTQSEREKIQSDRNMKTIAALMLTILLCVLWVTVVVVGIFFLSYFGDAAPIIFALLGGLTIGYFIRFVKFILKKLFGLE